MVDEEIRSEIKILRSDMDNYMNTGTLNSSWDDSPHKQPFCATIDAMKGHLPVPHSLNDILDKEAKRRIAKRSS